MGVTNRPTRWVPIIGTDSGRCQMSPLSGKLGKSHAERLGQGAPRCRCAYGSFLGGKRGLAAGVAYNVQTNALAESAYRSKSIACIRTCMRVLPCRWLLIEPQWSDCLGYGPPKLATREGPTKYTGSTCCRQRRCLPKPCLCLPHHSPVSRERHRRTSAANNGGLETWGPATPP
jgi:hypothetical protein